MQVLAVVLLVVAAAQAGYIGAPTTLVRTPSLDSAVIKSDRLGGNFAYSSVEGHAYAAISPVVENVVSPVGVSYTSTPYATPITAPVTTYSAALPYAAGLPYAARAAPLGLGYSGLGYAGLGYSGLGYSGLGYSGLGYSGLAYAK